MYALVNTIPRQMTTIIINCGTHAFSDGADDENTLKYLSIKVFIYEIIAL